MRRRAMSLDRRLVAVDLHKVVDVLVLPVLQDVEAQTPRLVALGADRVDLDRLEELVALFRLDPDLDPQRQHCRPLERDYGRRELTRAAPPASPVNVPRESG